jgi:hypothetical protein
MHFVALKLKCFNVYLCGEEKDKFTDRKVLRPKHFTEIRG